MPTIDGRFYVALDGLLTAAECQALIAQMDPPAGEEGSRRLQAVDSALAAYDRGILTSAEWAARLWARVKPHVPDAVAAVAHCNSTIRFSKYRPGQRFDVHRDGLNQDARGYRTKYTVNIFLNDAFAGGETDFLDEARELAFRAAPAPGRGVVFDRDILHRGNEVRDGTKYLLRTDVMVPDGV